MYYSFVTSLGSLESSHLAKWSHQYNNDLILILILDSVASAESFESLPPFQSIASLAATVDPVSDHTPSCATSVVQIPD